MSSAELNEFLSFLASPEIGVIKITGNSIALNPDPALYEAAE
jgi:hypothetical protein